MFDGFAIALAWPETRCKQANAWYDLPMSWIGVNRNGYYKVGHAALLLVDSNNGHCHYADFGRYHAPKGHGRVRTAETDKELTLHIKAVFNSDEMAIVNLNDILLEVYNNGSTHGDGPLYASTVQIEFEPAHRYITSLQDRDFVAYGPFIPSGTNCSRFVNRALIEGNPSLGERLKLCLSPTICPTPLWNVQVLNSPTHIIGETADVPGLSVLPVSSEMVTPH
ncbi:MAG: hypothetical protein JJ975_06210 [Bacteroidia bacterium]|nr:hypothetical protein [Bacteroidia bacterium]